MVALPYGRAPTAERTGSSPSPCRRVCGGRFPPSRRPAVAVVVVVAGCVPVRVEHVAEERQGACHGVPRDALSARRVISPTPTNNRACTPETCDQPAAARTFPLCLVLDLVQNGE